jgi:hypothetical protein
MPTDLPPRREPAFLRLVRWASRRWVDVRMQVLYLRHCVHLGLLCTSLGIIHAGAWLRSSLLMRVGVAVGRLGARVHPGPRQE